MKNIFYSFTIVLTLLNNINSEELPYDLNRSNFPTPKFFSESFVIQLENTENNTRVSSAEIAKISILLQELSFNNRIEVGDSKGYKFLRFLPTENARSNEKILLFSNSSKLNLSEAIRSQLSVHGEHFLFVDLSTIDASTEDINSLLSFTKKVKVLIMPIIGGYKIKDIDFPKSLVSLVLYNQKIPQTLLVRNPKLEELVMWGCDMPVSDVPQPSKYSAKNLSKITLINSGINLLRFIQGNHFENLKEVTIDDQTMLWRMIERESVEKINFYTYRISKSKHWPESLLARNFNRLRPVDAPRITINVFD